MSFRVALISLLVPLITQAQNAEVRYAPAASWVVPMQPRVAPAGQKEGPVYFTYSDLQMLTTGSGIEEYQAFRVKLLQREALNFGNINLAWMPDSGGVTVHHLRIIRDGEVIDVLQDTKFSVFQPQNGIEYSILSGERLANVQVPGLRVGDEIEFAYTTRIREIALSNNSYGLTQVAAVPASGSFRVRMTWPDGKEPKWRVSDDISGQLKRQGNALEVQLDDPPTIQFAEDAPARYGFKRALEFSDFKSWQELSALMAPLFSDAARLPAASRVKELAARIKNENPDQISRARAALQLVQDEVRYVYVDMNGGNLVPASADSTWQRRYGDCKAKTVLLMALLSELGIPSRPVVVSSDGGDGINEHLPNPRFFDHVMVQADIGGVWYWLDGTRVGDLRMKDTPPDFYKWVLPLTAAGTDISPVRFAPLASPEEINVVDIDARGGFDKPAKMSVQSITRGDSALAMRAALASLPVAEAESRLKQTFSQSAADIESVRWKFDADSATLVISVVSNEMIDWDKVSGETRWATSIVGAGFFPPPRRKRTGEDALAPWSNDPHVFSCHVTTMQLPKADADWIWTHNSKAEDQVIGGVSYWRMADLTADTMRTVMSKRTVRDEISPAEAEAANNQIPGFNNNQSQVYQVKGPGGWSDLEVADRSIREVPTAAGHDWVKDSSPCIAPRLRAQTQPLNSLSLATLIDRLAPVARPVQPVGPYSIQGRIVQKYPELTNFPTPRNVGILPDYGPIGIPSTPIAEDGTFMFSGFVAGGYQLATDRGWIVSGGHVEIKDASLRDIKLEVAPTISADVQALNEDGNPIPNLSPGAIRIAGLLAGQLLNSAIGPDGRGNALLIPGPNFVFVMPPSGYVVKSVRAGNTDLLKSPLVVDPSKPAPKIEARLGRTSSAPGAGVRVRGKASGDSRGSEIRLVAVGGNAREVYLSRIGADGSFEFIDVTPAIYRVEVPPIEEVAPYVAVVGGTMPRLEITLPSGVLVGAQIIRVEDSTGRASPSLPATVALQFQGKGSPTRLSVGKRSLFSGGLPAGTYTVTVEDLPSEYSVKSITAGTVNLLKDPLVLEKGKATPQIQIVLAVKR